MKENEESLETGGFEEVNTSGSSDAPSERKSSENRPDIRIVQTVTDREGRQTYKNVGGMWKNVSKNGNEFYTLMIGNLKLLAFPNTNK